MPRKFPPTREDGSFCVVVKFEPIQNAADLRDQVAKWCEQWIAENNDTSGEPVILGEIVKEPFNYFRAYNGPPSVIKAEGNQFWLRFDGKPDSYWWRDWLARMMANLTHVFPEFHAKKAKVTYRDD